MGDLPFHFIRSSVELVNAYANAKEGEKMILGFQPVRRILSSLREASHLISDFASLTRFSFDEIVDLVADAKYAGEDVRELPISSEGRPVHLPEEDHMWAALPPTGSTDPETEIVECYVDRLIETRATEDDIDRLGQTMVPPRNGLNDLFAQVDSSLIVSDTPASLVKAFCRAHIDQRFTIGVSATTLTQEPITRRITGFDPSSVARGHLADKAVKHFTAGNIPPSERVSLAAVGADQELMTVLGNNIFLLPTLNSHRPSSREIVEMRRYLGLSWARMLCVVVDDDLELVTELLRQAHELRDDSVDIEDDELDPTHPELKTLRRR